MSGFDFEQEVRTIARAIWAGEPGTGASEIVGGRERDCIFEQEHLTHYLEITQLRTLEKVRSDAQKMVNYRAAQLKKGKLVKLWIVTFDEPTADQRTYCNKLNIQILSVKEFRRNIIDASQYLELRYNHSFGSASDPITDSNNISNVKYQPVAIYNERTQQNVNIYKIAELLNENKSVVLLGDYGMGKSLNIREIFLSLRKTFFETSGASLMPVVLNLREHWGQVDPFEALRRHADIIGFDKPHQLIRAFNAGRLAIILDGFDEIGATPWTRLLNDKARTLRKNAVQLVARFVSSTRGKCGLLIAGREHFFDTRSELMSAFGITAVSTYFSLSEFTDDEAREFLSTQGYSLDLPDWFPKRPLLLASLAGKGLISKILEAVEGVEPAVAWDKLVDLVCFRESEIHQYLDSDGIRQILEELASEARNTPSNLGPITEDQIAEAFRGIVGAYPDESARPLLQRLPGLSARNQEDGSRTFLDDQMIDTLRAGGLTKYIKNPWADPSASNWQHGIGSLGIQVAYEKLAGTTVISEAIIAAKEAVSRWNSPTLAIDCLQIAQAMSVDDSGFDCDGLSIEEGFCDVLDLANYPRPKGLKVSGTIIYQLILPSEPVLDLSLDNCLIDQVYGISEAEKLPFWCHNCTINKFDEAVTNAKIMEEGKLSLSVRVMLTILRKLYVQMGSGRRENAFYRGLDDKAKKHVEQVLEILQQEKLIFSTRLGGNIIWHRVAGQQKRVNQIVETSGSNKDPIIDLVKAIVS